VLFKDILISKRNEFVTLTFIKFVLKLHPM